METYPTGRIYLVLDNGSSHRSKLTQEFFEQFERLVPVFLPVHASWLNQVEIWFSALKRQVLKGASSVSIDQLKARILLYIETHNQKMAKPYKWTTEGRPLTGSRLRCQKIWRQYRNTLPESQRANR
jgi:transposase